MSTLTLFTLAGTPFRAPLSPVPSARSARDGTACAKDITRQETLHSNCSGGFFARFPPQYLEAARFTVPKQPQQNICYQTLPNDFDAPSFQSNKAEEGDLPP